MVRALPTSVLYPFSNSAGGQPAPAPTPTPTPGPPPPPPPPPPVLFRDVLTPVGFTIPENPPTTFVSGGGPALASAVMSVSAGETIEIIDSLNYDAITIMGVVDITIRAATGQTPSITAGPGAFDHAVSFQGVNSGVRLKGLTFIGNGNSGSHSAIPDLARTGIVHMSYVDSGIFMDRIIIEDCIFSEPAPTAGNGAPGLNFFGDGVTISDNVWIHRCKFMNVGAVTALASTIRSGAITIAGFNNVFIQNCLIVRTDAVLSEVLSNMKGIVVQNTNTIVEDVLCDRLGTNGIPQAFINSGLPGISIAFASTATFRNCVAYNCKIGYECGTTTGAVTVRMSVYNADAIAPAGVVMRRSFGAYIARDCVLTAQGGGITFSATGIVEDHNDVFNFGSTGKVLDPTDQTIDPLYEDVPRRIFRATAPSLQTGASDGGLIGVRYGSGEEIFWVNTPQGT